MTLVGPHHLKDVGLSKDDLQSELATPPIQADGTMMTPAIGSFEGEVTIGHHTTRTRFGVHHGVKNPIMSFGVCKALKLLPQQFPDQPCWGAHACTVQPTSPLTSKPADGQGGLWQQYNGRSTQPPGSLQPLYANYSQQHLQHT